MNNKFAWMFLMNDLFVAGLLVSGRLPAVVVDSVGSSDGGLKAKIEQFNQKHDLRTLQHQSSSTSAGPGAAPNNTGSPARTLATPQFQSTPPIDVTRVLEVTTLSMTELEAKEFFGRHKFMKTFFLQETIEAKEHTYSLSLHPCGAKLTGFWGNRQWLQTISCESLCVRIGPSTSWTLQLRRPSMWWRAKCLALGPEILKRQHQAPQFKFVASLLYVLW